MNRPTPADPRSMCPVEQVSAAGPPAALLEAYKKHVEELRGIDDRQNKILAGLLAIFSAAATLLVKGPVDLGPLSALYMSLVALVIVFIGQHAIDELHDFRVATRDLLVRCEVALHYYEIGAFMAGRMLYTEYELDYPHRGKWMKQNYWIVWLICGGFVLLLWIRTIANWRLEGLHI
jgi:hypothetical protein